MIFIFPGQGSQYVGMGKSLYNNFSIAKETFQEIDDAVNFNLSDIIFNGPEEKLSLTENTQPAIMAVSVAALRVLIQEAGLKNPMKNVMKNSVQYVAGHSLGEYSALYASGVLSVGEIAKLLRFRGQAMQRAVPQGKGAMAALLKTNYDEVKNLLFSDSSSFTGCEISNDNSNDQVVVSGYTEKIDEFIEFAKNNGIKKVVKLNVSAPFHCKLMQPAADEMQKRLAEVKFNSLEIPIISNVTAKCVNDSEEMKNLLVEQIVKCVRWREIIKFCEENSMNKFLEIGPGNVLSKLVQRTLSNSNSSSNGSSNRNCNLGDVSELENAIKFITDGN